MTPGNAQGVRLPFDILCRIFVAAQQPSLVLVARVFYQASKLAAVRARFLLAQFGRRRVLDGNLGLATRRPRMLRQDVVLLLLALGADPRADSQWILQYACIHAWLPVLRRLLSTTESSDSCDEPDMRSWRAGSFTTQATGEKMAPLVDVRANDDAALIVAAAHGHAAVIRLLATAGADVNAAHGEALARAAAAGHAQATRALLDCGASASIDDSRALRGAVLGGDANIVCVQMLLDSGANVRALDDSCLLAASYRGDGEPVQHRYRRDISSQVASSARTRGFVQLVRLLLQRGADANARSGRPLIFACSRGSPLTAAELLRHGADLHVRNNEPLRLAAERGHREVVRLLIRHFDTSQDTLLQEDGVCEALRLAAQGGHLDVVRMLLEHCALPAATNALVAAARGGWADVVRLLVDHGADSTNPDVAIYASRSRIVRRALGWE
ncbi:hypothetical protein GGI07_004684 [Coemansia sp. Benny D115]|nr:hypothetical protein GGI07_004684 [Coemansia sp. Benny D115]